MVESPPSEKCLRSILDRIHIFLSICSILLHYNNCGTGEEYCIYYVYLLVHTRSELAGTAHRMNRKGATLSLAVFTLLTNSIAHARMHGPI